MHANIIHKLATFLLAVIYAFTMFKPLIPVVHYTANYGYYVNELCENKDQPELQCNGTCELMKKLNIDSPAEEDKPLLPVFEGLQWYVGFLNSAVEIQSLSENSLHNVFYFHDFANSLFAKVATPPPRSVG